MIRFTVTTLLCLQATKYLAAQQSDTAHNQGTLLDDAVSAETGFASAVQAGSKYFQDLYMAQETPDELEFGHVRETPHDWEQRYEKINLKNLKRQGKVMLMSRLFWNRPSYAHVPEKDHYEIGHKRGNEHHFIERHEKAHPHAGEFKTKVRWGDKHGGYGEHYWDYNHDGHGHDGDGEETQYEPQYAEPETVVAASNAGTNGRHKRGQLVDPDVEFVGEEGRQRAALSGPHGGNYRRHPRVERIRRQFDDDDY